MLIICRKSFFSLRLRSKKGEIAAHWESVSFENCLVIAFHFGRYKDGTTLNLSQFPNTLLKASQQQQIEEITRIFERTDC